MSFIHDGGGKHGCVPYMSNQVVEVPAYVTQTPVRTFETGATRDSDVNKFDYEGFLSPIVLERYGAYMHKHRKQSDGVLRPSDNWQKGIPKEQYLKSTFRHFMDLWKLHRGYKTDAELEDTLCALMFNIMGYLFEVRK